MEDFRKTLDTYRQNAKAEAEALDNAFREYAPQVRLEKQKSERKELSSRHSLNAKLFVGRIDKRLQEVSKEMTQKKFPLLTSVLESERLRGTIDYNSATQIRERYPSGLLRKALEMNRNDLASALVERLEWEDEPQENDVVQRAKFLQFKKTADWYKEQSGISALEKERTELEKVRKLTLEYQKQAEADFAFNPKTYQEYSELMAKIRA